MPYLSRPNHAPKHHKQAVGQCTGHISTEPSAKAPRVSRRARCGAHLDPNHPPKYHERAIGHATKTTHVSHQVANRHALNHLPSRSCHASHRVNYRAFEPADRQFQNRTELLRLFAVNPLTVGELGGMVIVTPSALVTPQDMQLV